MNRLLVALIAIGFLCMTGMGAWAHTGYSDVPKASGAPTTLPTPSGPPLLPVVGKNGSHLVSAGEDLYTLGLRYGLAIEHFMWANNLPNEKAPVGKKLVVPSMRIAPGALDEGLIVNLPERGMYLYKNHDVIAFYPCAIGMGGRFATPLGEARIIARQVDPTWTPPDWASDKTPVPPGPGNPLGDRWIGLSMDGVGMHGTNQPMSIGQAASHGCMRMYPSIVRKLFEQVRIGMPVRIIYDPIKLGIGSVDKKIYVQVFPDVYNLVPDSLAYLRDKLARAGLGGLVDDDQLRQLLGRKTGLLQPLLGEDITVKVNGKKIGTTLAPFLKGGQIWVTSEVLSALGAQVFYKEQDKSMRVSRYGLGLKMPCEDHLWNGKSVLPIKPVLAQLRVTYKWVGARKTLLIYCPEMNTPI